MSELLAVCQEDMRKGWEEVEVRLETRLSQMHFQNDQVMQRFKYLDEGSHLEQVKRDYDSYFQEQLAGLRDTPQFTLQQNLKREGEALRDEFNRKIEMVMTVCQEPDDRLRHLEEAGLEVRGVMAGWDR